MTSFRTFNFVFVLLNGHHAVAFSYLFIYFFEIGPSTHRCSQKSRCLHRRPEVITSCRTSSWSGAEPSPTSGRPVDILQPRCGNPPRGLPEAKTPCRSNSASSAHPWFSRILVTKGDMKLAQTLTAPAVSGFNETETCFCMRDVRNAFPIPAYQLLVLRRMPLLNMTSRRAVVWQPSCQIGWQSAAWQSRWRKRHHPPWEGERAGPSTQLHHNSLRWESFRETHTAVMHCL